MCNNNNNNLYMPLCVEAFFIKANWMALVHMTYCYFSIHFFTYCALAISIFDVYHYISGTMVQPGFTRSGSSTLLLSRHRFTPNMFLKLTRLRRWGTHSTQWSPSWRNGIWTITVALASHLLSELVTRDKWFQQEKKDTTYYCWDSRNNFVSNSSLIKINRV